MEDDKHFYANALQASVSAYDIGLTFIRNGVGLVEGMDKDKPQQGKPSAKDSLTVTMSPSHFKAMLPGLLRLVSEYEKQFGSIPIPPDAVEAWKGLEKK